LIKNKIKILKKELLNNFLLTMTMTMTMKTSNIKKNELTIVQWNLEFLNNKIFERKEIIMKKKKEYYR
jgi:hypothetical protein